MSICRTCYHAVANTFSLVFAVEAVPEVRRWAALKYHHEEIVNAVCSDNRHDGPDDDLLVLLNTDTQQEITNADFKNGCARDVADLSNPPTLGMSA